MTTEEKAKAYDEALKKAKEMYDTYRFNVDPSNFKPTDFEYVFPQLAESDDERIRKALINALKVSETIGELKFRLSEPTREKAIAYLEKQKEASKAIEAVERIDKYIDEHVENAHDMKDSHPDKKYCQGIDDTLAGIAWILQDVYSNEKQEEQKPKRDIVSSDAIESCMLRYLQSAANRKDDIEIIEDTKAYKSELISIIEKEQKPIKMEVYEVGKGTTICGQDYKCKKDYKEGNCWYVKDVIYHCGKDGYLNDQNGVSWSCTPEWFNEYIYTNSEWADEEKNYFVSGQFLRCKLSFDEFKEGEHYWLEYVGDDMYVGRSDNILNQKFHITPRQLYTLFSQQLEEVQGPSQEEKQVSLNYEPPFNETPSDEQIIDALIHHLNEQDGFLTAINCVSTKAILSWLKKQKEQKSEWNKVTINGEPIPTENQSVDISLAKWSEEDSDNLERVDNYLWMLDNYVGDDCATPQGKVDKIRGNIQEVLSPWLKSLPERFNLQPKQEWSEEDEKALEAVDESLYCYESGKAPELVAQIEAERYWLQSLPLNFKKKNEDVAKLCSNEWSEEDEEMFEAFMHKLEVCDLLTNKEIMWAKLRLKFLHPSWKPTEHQMSILKAVKEYVGKGSGYWGEGLGSLIDDLEKLM